MHDMIDSVLEAAGSYHIWRTVDSRGNLPLLQRSGEKQSTPCNTSIDLQFTPMAATFSTLGVRGATRRSEYRGC